MNDEHKTTLEAVESTAPADAGTSELPAPSKPSPRVVKLEELREAEAQAERERWERAKLYEATLARFQEREIVRGRITAITDREVYVDVGLKSEGVIPIQEFKDITALKPGDEVEVYIESVEDVEGRLVLSRRKADLMRIWERIEQAYRNDEVVEGEIKRRVKGGMMVDLFGVEAFLPGSQIDVRPVRDFDAYLGKRMEFKIVKLNRVGENVVVSHRVLIEKDLEEQRQRILENLERGQVLEGTVKNITDFGVFIDLGGVDGLLHITDLSWGRVNHPSEVVQLDQRLQVVVLDFDENKQRISLGLKQLQPHPWENIEERYFEGMRTQGRVVSLTEYGAFVELEKGIEGLVHVSEMSWTQHVKHPAQMLSVGQIVDVVILSIDKENRKISLGIKQLTEDPWNKIPERYPIGSRHLGTVKNLAQYGAFIELEPGIEGLVHVSDLSWTKKIRHPAEMLKKGQQVEVVILDIDAENRRISLGIKQLEEDPWDTFAQVYAVGTDVKGTVRKFIEKGVVVELPYGGVEGFVPNNHLARLKEGDPAQLYKVGEQIELRVIEFDRQEQKIILSETVLQKARERERREAERAQREAQKRAEAEARAREQAELRQVLGEEPAPPTLAELSGLAPLSAEAEPEAAQAEPAPQKRARKKSPSKGAQAE
ncbi:MAG: 30S ribosomal protein S1 [Bacteroidota bacterium]|nr:30S ribosomal protein S1 [Rhodothermia bacterium]MCS7154257.1 30S ribosomal protein S1 [Bacteroidota bacterium]MDW8285116.1 30S ribosomal protein S1 [Bacteroidota bacterium]